MSEPWPLKGYGVELNPISADKLETIRQWRNHPDIVKFMKDKRIISEAHQKQWFAGLAEKTQQLYLMVSYKGQDIGVIYAKTHSKVNTDNTALNLAPVIEPGLYIAPDCQYKNSVLAFSPSLVFIDYLFKQGQCIELKAEVFEYNNGAIRYNKMLGYQQGEVDKDGLLTMTLTLADFERAKQTLSKVLRF